MAHQINHTVLVQLEGVTSKEETPFYLGKKLAYIYKAKTLKLRLQQTSIGESKVSAR